MSEYQYYEFRAVDRPLTRKEQEELRALSTRATISATLFQNHYEWGDFKGNPARLMERYFDAFLYFANWGTRHVA
jgi:arylsulfatase A-like enzyme